MFRYSVSFSIFSKRMGQGGQDSFLGLKKKTLLNICPFIPLKDVKNTCFGPEKHQYTYNLKCQIGSVPNKRQYP